jgi:hypothetical protein
MTDLELSKKLEYRKKVTELEQQLKNVDGYIEGKDKDEVNPLKHTFADGCYIREVFMPANQLIVTKIHKVEHPIFIQKGHVSILTDAGIEEIKAPYQGITKPGTKRVMYTHEDTVLITVHATNKKTPEEVEEEVIAKNFDDPVISIEEINLLKNNKS